LAEHLGISTAETVAFGDADNDIPLFEWAGVSVAMPHGWPTAQRHATAIGPEGPPETALARAVDLALSGSLESQPKKAKIA
jgi:hydroxymethylpyrimidine pyrophosphatase-like HAD family hydrolase